MFGFVYFIASNRGIVKIGWSSDVAKRLRTLQTSSPEELTLLGYVPGGRDREAEIQERWRAERVRLEWFNDTPELRSFIEALLEEPPEPQGEYLPVWEDDPIFVENAALFLRALGDRREGEAVSAAVDRLCDLLQMQSELIYRLWYKKVPTISVGLYRKIEEVAASRIGDVMLQRRINRHAYRLAETSLDALKRFHAAPVEPTGMARAEDRPRANGGERE